MTHTPTPHKVVAIGIIGGKGYRKVLSSHATAREAMEAVISKPVRSYSPVYRDGLTGKRYCFNECKEMLANIEKGAQL